MDAYKHLANVYDKLMDDVDYDEWAEYIDAFLKEYKAKKILEVSCGTGNLTFRLSNKGYDIIASDSSAAMLSIAKKKNAQLCADVRFVHQDIRKIETTQSVDAIVSVCDGPNYIDFNGFERFANSAFISLKSGGVLLFDVSSEHKLKEKLDENVFFDEGEDTICIWKNKFDKQRQALIMDVTLFVKQGELYARLSETHTQYAHTVQTLESVLKKTGFSDVCVFECFTKNKPRKSTQRLQFVCYKV